MTNRVSSQGPRCDIDSYPDVGPVCGPPSPSDSTQLECHPNPAVQLPQQCEAQAGDVPASRLGEARVPPTPEQEVGSLVDEARVMAPAVGARHLEGAAMAFERQGLLDQARVLYRELQQSPFAEVSRHAMDRRFTSLKASDTAYDAARHVLKDKGLNETTIAERGFKLTQAGFAEAKLLQLDQRQRMEDVLGRTVNLRDLDAAREYFARVAAQGPEHVSRELGLYLRAAYVHSGDGVTWTSTVPMDERPAKLGSLLGAQPRDEAGRTVIDCEGFAMLADRLLDGDQYDVSYASRPGHVIAVVREKGAGEAMFFVDNATATPPSYAERSAEDRAAAVGRQLCGNTYDVFQISRRQSASEPVEPGDVLGMPRVGAAVFDGERVRGVVTEEIREMFRDARNRTGVTFSGFLKRELE